MGDDKYLQIRGVPIVSASELTQLKEALGDELSDSSTIRAWLAGEPVLPHSAGVSLEMQARMISDESAAERTLLIEIVNRLADLFPDEVLPLDL